MLTLNEHLFKAQSS